MDSSIGTETKESQEAYTSDAMAGTIAISEGACCSCYTSKHLVDNHGKRYICISKYM